MTKRMKLSELTEQLLAELRKARGKRGMLPEVRTTADRFGTFARDMGGALVEVEGDRKFITVHLPSRTVLLVEEPRVRRLPEDAEGT